MSPREALGSYDHIELTEEETQDAILQAKIKKHNKEVEAAKEAQLNERRKLFTGNQWTVEQTSDYMLYRAAKLFDGSFGLDKENRPVFDLLCAYFSNDKSFLSLALMIGIESPSLDKGLFLAGNFGVGKTWLMRLFAKNTKQVYEVINAKYIADAFTKGKDVAEGEELIEEFVQNKKNAFEDPDCFYQKFSGLCIDDLGTEDIKNNYGNKKNVIGDLIEKRYAKGTAGIFLHATTNLSAEQLKEFYGGRVISRMRELFNYIELPGKDRRK